MKVLVLGGGDSPERDVSFRSAKAVADGARKAGYEVREYDPAKGFDYFDKLPKDTIVLPILHGINGEDGILQEEFAKRGLAFLGSTSEVMKATFNKSNTLERLKEAGILTAKSNLVTDATYVLDPISEAPHVLKVNHGGSSIGVMIVREPSKADQGRAKKVVFDLDDQAVLEELVEGVEITIPILDELALPAIEVIPPGGGEFDYENKYNGASQELCPPVSISDEQHAKARELAEKVHRTMRCRHLSRVDTLMRPDGSFVVLEINTIPGLTEQSLYPKSARVAGIDMPVLVNRFVELVKRDYNL